MSLKTANILAILLACTAIAQSKDCNKACTFDYNPVCGFNSVTGDYQIFGNPCVFETAQCEDSVWTKAGSLASCEADATVFAAAELKCEKPCTREFNPVCGFNGDVHHVFSNLCELENAHCADGKAWFKTMMTDCYIPVQERCEKPCTREYVPVCGYNGEKHQVFANKCEFENAHCQDGKTWNVGVMANCLARNAAPQKNAINNQDNTNECPKMCPMIYQPTCGFDGQSYKFFSNRCEMKVNNCNQRTNFQLVSLDLCNAEKFQNIALKENDCPTMCPMIYQPTCGFDGQNYKFFSSKCEMEVKNCNEHSTFQIVGLDLCESEKFSKIALRQKECPKICPAIYKPTCGFNGQTYKMFASPCMMETANCNEESNFKVVSFEKCSEVSFVSMEDTEEKKCRKACPFIYFPMCGFFNGVYKMFDNLCSMEVENCEKNINFQVVSLEKCDDDYQMRSLKADKKNCNRRCNKMYRPTCGFDGKSYKMFSNPCVMEASNCNEETNFQVVELENCNQPEFISLNTEEKPCPKICPLNYVPTCGFDGQNYKIFSNTCEMEATNCNKKSKYELAPLSDCQ